MATDTLILNAVGDVTAFHDEPEKAFEYVGSVLRDADIGFAQNERHYTRGHQESALGFTEEVSADHAESLKAGGFDVVSFASNHAMDLGADGLMETVGVLKDLGFAVIGVGRNIEEARKPAFIEKKGIKVAFLAYASVLRPNYQAGKDKAGCAPMRARTLYEQWNYQPGTAPHIYTFPYKEDLEAMVEDVKKAKAEADVVVLSQHWGVHFVHAVIADYQREVAHAVIDAGADLILGHHPHQLKGIEVYKGKPIFYSRNFAFDLTSKIIDGWIKAAPHTAAAFKEQGWAYGDPEWAMYAFPPECRTSMIVRCSIGKNGVEKASFLPVLINKQAQPQIVPPSDKSFGEILQYMKDITASQGLKTTYTPEGGEIVVSLR